MLITPNGDALPCHAPASIPGCPFENVKAPRLSEIWNSSDAFSKFRGESWMQEPAKPAIALPGLRGCRCQAFSSSRRRRATDPVCSLSPLRPKVDAILGAINSVGGLASR